MAEDNICVGRDHGFDAEMFRRFLAFDVGTGQPLFWHSIGRLYRDPDGQVVCRVEALISNRLCERTANSATAVCRTLLIYRDVDSGQIIDFEGAPQVREYPYIVARFELHGQQLKIRTEGLSGPHNGRYGVAHVTADNVFAHRAAGTDCFYWTLFGSVKTAKGEIHFVEAYNGTTSPSVMVMNRTGTLPHFAGHGTGLLQTTARDYNRFEDIPPDLRSYVLGHYPEHVAPPLDLSEVDRLRTLYLENG